MLEGKTIGYLAIIGVLALVITGVWIAGDHHAHVADKAKYEAQIAKYQEAATQAEIAAQRMADAAQTAQEAQAHESSAIDQAYAQGLQNGEYDGTRVVAQLRAGNLRLRKLWREAVANRAGVPRTHSAVRAPDATEQRRQDSAGRVIGAAEQCDAQVAALQAWIRAALKALQTNEASR